MGLQDYQRKRDFARTPEPAGGASEGRGLTYVIQKHAATALHFDFRLELDGVLLSWAVPKGPSLDPGERRLAMRTEDHPLDYRHFEGVIPAGEYGGGTVMLWDRGHWKPDGNARKALKAGKLEFTLYGDRLLGGWRLVRTRGMGDGKESWLLMKRTDRHARDERQGRYAEEVVTSVVSGRTMEEIASARERVWSSTEGEVAAGGARGGTRMPSELQEEAAELKGRRRKDAPLLRPRPMRATAARSAPAGDGWLHEMAVDGERALARVQGGQVRLLDAAGEDLAAKHPEVAATLAEPKGLAALLDGALTVMQPDGTTSRAGLAEDASVPIYLAWDLLHVGRWDLRGVALEARKALLRRLIHGVWGEEHPRVRYVDHVRGSGPQFRARACELGVPAVLSKRADSGYEAGTSKAWRRAPCQESLSPPRPARRAAAPRGRVRSRR